MVLLPEVSVPEELIIAVEEALEVIETGHDESAERAEIVPVVAEFIEIPVDSLEPIAMLEVLLRQVPKRSSHPSPQ